MNKHARYETAKTAYDAHASNISSEGVNVVAPVNGYLANRLVVQGEYVLVGQPIASIAEHSAPVKGRSSRKSLSSVGRYQYRYFKTAIAVAFINSPS